MKYIELGVGNRWLLRTEVELEDGTEYEEKGIIGPISVQSIYLRIWIRKRVYILDSKEGFKKADKNKNKLKIIFGIMSL